MKHDFSYILDPIDSDFFFKNHYEKKPLVIKRQHPSYYDSILTIEDINSFLAQAHLFYPMVRVVKASEKVPSANYSYFISSPNSGLSENIIDKDKLFYYFYNGFTIILKSYERQNIDLLYLRHEFEKKFFSRAHTNIYLTPRNAQGFPAHFDLHDVFILQIHGSKEWNVYDSPIELPSTNKELSEINWVKPKEYLTVLLEQGDLLYIPRGFVHEAKAQNDASIHITLGIPTYKNSDLLREAIFGLEHTLFFRKSLPLLQSDNKEIEVAFKRYLSEYIEKCDVKGLIEKIKDNFIDTRLFSPKNSLIDYMNIDSVNLATLLKQKTGIFYKTSRNGNKIELRFNNKVIKFPLFVELAFDHILDDKKFKISDLPDTIADESKIIICKKLIMEGFLTILKYEDQ